MSAFRRNGIRSHVPLHPTVMLTNGKHPPAKPVRRSGHLLYGTSGVRSLLFPCLSF